MRLIITILFFLPLFCKAQDFYLSATGNDGNNGLTKATAKATMKAIDTLINASTLPSITAAIEGGGEFRMDANEFTRAGVTITTYDRTLLGKSALPKFTGTTIHNSGWSLTGSNTYQKSITHTINIGTGTLLNGYGWIYVIEIDTLLERTAPLTARKYLTWKSVLADVETTAGSYYAPSYNPSQSPVVVSIHTSNNESPNSNTQYRYEVVTSSGPVAKRLGGTTYGHQINVKGLFALDYGSGVGAIASSLDSMTVDSSVIMGTAIHAGVFGNYSTVKNSAYIGGEPNINNISIVFYQTQGANETNSVLNSTFLGNNKGVYTHTTSNPTTKHGKLSVKNSYFYNSQSQVVSSLDCDTLEVDYVYADSVDHFSQPLVATAYLSNTIVRNAARFNYSHTSNVFINNCFFKSNPHFLSLPLDNGYLNRTTITNSIIHIKHKNLTGTSSSTLFKNLDTTTRWNAQRNIFIIEPHAAGFTRLATANTWGGAGTGPDTFDYNVYIIVSGRNPYWTITNGATNGGVTGIDQFSVWKTQSGQDSHSIWMDLRSRSIPLTDIFVDPDNGNYTLTNSVRADSIRAVGAGMTTPILRWPSVPTREQVLATVTNGTFANVSTLMDPNYTPPVDPPPYVPPVIIPASNVRGSKRIGANLKFN